MSHDESPQLIPVEALRWRCDPAIFRFETTAELEPIGRIVGQDAAMEALRFGLECRADGQHVFVSGLTGTGRKTLIHHLLEEIQPSCPLPEDRIYVHNFDEPMTPTLITLARGQAVPFARKMDEFANFVRDQLGNAITTAAIRARLEAMERATQARIKRLSGPFEERLTADDLALVTVTTGNVARSAVFARVAGVPVPPEELQELHAKGELSTAELQAFDERIARHEPELDTVAGRVEEVMSRHTVAALKLLQTEARNILRPRIGQIKASHHGEPIAGFLRRVLDDILEHRIETLDEATDFVNFYRVNRLISHPANAGCPVIIEASPSVNNLVGGIERELDGETPVRPDHLSIRAGSLLRADRGFLILGARDVIEEPDAWRTLMRTLRNKTIEIKAAANPLLGGVVQLTPESIPIDVKVILVGDAELFAELDEIDPDFPQLFKVLAEFDQFIPRTPESIQHYANVIARVQRDGGYPPFDRAAVAALVEHGARIASCRDKLTTRFGRVSDIAAEAAFLAGKEGSPLVTGELVRETIRRTRRRAELSSRRFREMLANGTIRVQTAGRVVGQLNGLAVQHAGHLTYGFPARITATIGPGTAGVINIEREAALSGAIHTKGFYILSGLLRFLLKTNHPLAFEASIAFEQSYGGIDGDSASGAEICCLLSALTEIPLRQDMAMTGAIDQLGNLLAIGGVNEKIEGFFDTCADVGLSGTQAVVIPQSNAGDLMLRHDVVDACRAGKFQVYAVGTVAAALELLTGRTAGERGETGVYPPGTLLAAAVDRAREFWLRASPPPPATPPAR